MREIVAETGDAIAFYCAHEGDAHYAGIPLGEAVRTLASELIERQKQLVALTAAHERVRALGVKWLGMAQYASGYNVDHRGTIWMLLDCADELESALTTPAGGSDR